MGMVTVCSLRDPSQCGKLDWEEVRREVGTAMPVSQLLMRA
jgi:hypothetical protein